MKKYKYDESNGLWYELEGDYYLPRLKLPEEEQVHIGIWGQRHLNYMRENKRVLPTFSKRKNTLRVNCKSVLFAVSR